MMRLAVIAAMALGALADQRAPTSFQGNWTGTIQVAYGNRLEGVDSLECTPAGQTITSPTTVRITDWTVNQGGWPARTIVVPMPAEDASYSLPAQARENFGFALFDGSSGNANGGGNNNTLTGAGIMTWRISPTEVMCMYARQTGNKLVIVDIGGDKFKVEDQCNIQTYLDIPNVETQPYCEAMAGSNAVPWGSSRVFTYTKQSSNNGNNGGDSGAGSAALALGAFAAAIGAGVANGF